MEKEFATNSVENNVIRVRRNNNWRNRKTYQQQKNMFLIRWNEFRFRSLLLLFLMVKSLSRVPNSRPESRLIFDDDIAAQNAPICQSSSVSLSKIECRHRRRRRFQSHPEHSVTHAFSIFIVCVRVLCFHLLQILNNLLLFLVHHSVSIALYLRFRWFQRFNDL